MASTETPHQVGRWKRLAKSLLLPDTIGPAECPICHRWTLIPPGTGSNSSSIDRHITVPDWMPKLLLHHFMPQADERHSHDHPRGFWTLVLWGGYDDLVPCDWCNSTGNMFWNSDHPDRRMDGYCQKCGSTGHVLGDRMRAGTLRYRPPEHIHRTRVHPEGAWTLVLMGPKRREWGFWLSPTRWMEWQEYFKEHGFGMRCI